MGSGGCRCCCSDRVLHRHIWRDDIQTWTDTTPVIFDHEFADFTRLTIWILMLEWNSISIVLKTSYLLYQWRVVIQQLRLFKWTSNCILVQVMIILKKVITTVRVFKSLCIGSTLLLLSIFWLIITWLIWIIVALLQNAFEAVKQVWSALIIGAWVATMIVLIAGSTFTLDNRGVKYLHLDVILIIVFKPLNIRIVQLIALTWTAFSITLRLHDHACSLDVEFARWYFAIKASFVTDVLIFSFDVAIYFLGYPWLVENGAAANKTAPVWSRIVKDRMLIITLLANIFDQKPKVIHLLVIYLSVPYLLLICANLLWRLLSDLIHEGDALRQLALLHRNHL